MSWWPFRWWTRSCEIFWLARANHELRVGLADQSEPQIVAVQERINRRLPTLFRTPCRICVTNLYRGYRTHPNRFILQVEVEQSGRDGVGLSPHVVKIFFDEDRSELETEGRAWRTCWGSNEPAGHVLMRVRCVENRHRQIHALVYQEATNSLGARQVINLEQAVLGCVRFNNPELSSVRSCITTLFANLRPLHERSHEVPPNNQVATVFPREPNLDRSLRVWSDIDPNYPDAHQSRGPVRRSGSCPGTPFIDPVDYLAYVRDSLARGTTLCDRRQPLVPTTRMGWAHGDLHGRNILVGVADNEAVTSPAVFDYGRMGPDQPVVLDFVKLETELKIRILPAIFARLNFQSRNPLMQEFEHVLNRWTNHLIECNADLRGELPEYWPPTYRADGSGEARRLRVPEPAEPLRRLLAVLLDIRFLAANVLRHNSLQPGNWFRQYLFWLAFYGLRTVRYTNLEGPQLQSAYFSAGVASAELQ